MSRIIYPINNKLYTAEDVEIINSPRTSGVYSVLDFDLSLSGNVLTVGKGLAWMKNADFKGKAVAFTEPETITLDSADSTLDRYDVVAVRYDATKKEPELIVIKGTASENPVMPKRNTESYLYELFLYSILRKAGESTASFENVTDLRENKNYCGIMEDSVTSAVAPVYETLFEYKGGENNPLRVGDTIDFDYSKYQFFIATIDGAFSENDVILTPTEDKTGQGKFNCLIGSNVISVLTGSSQATFYLRAQIKIDELSVTTGHTIQIVQRSNTADFNLENIDNSSITKLVGVTKQPKGYVAVDDVYNPESHNAQSGEAVKQAIKEALAEFEPPEQDNGNNSVSTKRHYGTFSVLGDSYSTFVDFVTPNTNLCWYPAGNENATGSNNDVSSVEQMWWHIFANAYESALQVNNSYSGSPICYDGWGSGNTDSTETGFIARANNIGRPELIFILGGTNDSWVGASIGEYKYSDWTEDDFVSFRPSLAYLLNYLKQHNAGAKIVFILNENLKSEIDESVLTICGHYGVEVLELENITTSNGHPTVAGQQSIAQQVFDFVTSSKITGITATISKSNFASGISLNDLKPYLTVTATYDDGRTETVTDYDLSGSVDLGTNTITISCGVYTATVDIVVAQAELTGISAEISQTEFAMGVTLDVLKTYLTVTATYDDGTSAVVTDYELSGEIVLGENTVSVTYGGKTTTVTITVAAESGTYQLSVETLDSPGQYQYYCPIFNTPVNESVRIVFTRDFELFSTNSIIKGSNTLPTSLKTGGVQLATVDISAEYVDQTVSVTSDYNYFILSIGTKAVNPLTLKNFHCYVDGVEAEPVDWVTYGGANEITVTKLS